MTVKPPVWLEKYVVETPEMHPVLKILPTNAGVQVWRPGHSERDHAVFIFQNMCGRRALFFSRHRDDHVVSMGLNRSVCPGNELLFPQIPINVCIFDVLVAARITDSVLIEADGRLEVSRGR